MKKRLITVTYDKEFLQELNLEEKAELFDNIMSCEAGEYRKHTDERWTTPFSFTSSCADNSLKQG